MRRVELLPGNLIDRYELLMPVAAGGTSQIWAARLHGTRGFEKLVALKTLAVPDSEDRELERMLWQEARVASKIHHTNVAQYFDLIEHEDALCLTMEWIDGESLSALIRESWRAGGVPLGVALRVVTQACKGLHAAHELRDADGTPFGLVHCDVSPQNLMIHAQGTVKLVDFGIAKVRSQRRAAELRPMGKPSFMAPEQALGQGVDRRTDVFALGVVLYLLTTGRHPHRQTNAADTLRAIASGAPIPPPSVLVTNYPRALEAIVMRALEHSPDARHATANELLDEIEAAFPRYASEGELATFLERVAGHSLAARRARLNEAMKRWSPSVAPQPGAALALSETSPNTLSPAILGAEANAQPAPPLGGRPARWALAATGVAFLAAFAWTFAAPFIAKTVPAAATQPEPGKPLEQPAPKVLVPAPADHAPAPAATCEPAAPPVTGCSSAAKNSAPPPAKKAKPLTVGARYGI